MSGPETGQKLLQFLQRRLEGAVPNPALQRWIRTGQVRVNGSRAKPGTRLEQGQKIRIPPYSPGQASASHSGSAPAGGLDIVHEDRDLLVLSKPGGLPVHPGTGHQDSIAARISASFAASPWKPTLVHRLDRDTSGLLVTAKTYSCLRAVQDFWRAGQVHKSYLAWVQGLAPWQTPSVLRDTAAKVATATGEKVVVGEHGKSQLSLVRTLYADTSVSLVLVTPITGRTHQIRVQLSSRGHPLIGDRKYAGTSCSAGMLLHAWHIRWPGHEFQLLPDWPRPWAIEDFIAPIDLQRMTRELIQHPAVPSINPEND